MSWIAVDWGTSQLRAWHMSETGDILASASSADGMGGLARDGFEPALLALISPWLAAGAAPEVYACGMVGARQGWTEAAYRPVPCTPVGPPLTRAPVQHQGLTVSIVPGLSQLRPHADVMRGEETQIAGLIVARPNFDGVVCLPGTHCKWAEISAGEVVSFQTAMTGELFALLSGHSVLRHSVGTAEFDEAAFDTAVSEALSRPEALAARLFALRANDLLTGASAASARARLSGLLIGAELAAAKPWWLGREVVLIGDGKLAALYARALTAQGLAPRSADATATVLAGLSAARKADKGETA